MTRRASIYERLGRVYICASHKTEAGFWIDDEFVEALDLDRSERIVEAVVSALNRSKGSVPTPSPSTSLVGSLLKSAGVKSWGVFEKSARYVGVTEIGDQITVEPTANLGARGGFVPISGKARTIPKHDAVLFDVILTAIEVSE